VGMTLCFPWKIFLVVASSAGIAVCQTQPAAGRVEFEVASLKPDLNHDRFFIKTAAGGNLSAANISLKRLVAVAYSVTDYQIFSGVTWLESQTFDLEAKAGGPADLGQLRLMLRSLLDDRFQLKIHKETRELPIYSLVVARKEGKGAGLVESPGGDCSAAATSQDSPPNGSRGRAIPCGTVNPGFGRISGRRGHISQLADRLSTILGRTVVDNTGLAGTYDIDLSWTPDPVMEPGQAPPPERSVPETSGLSLFTAIEEQLGLKLKAGKGQVEVIVVDSAGKLSAN
jgi:uncharacterized protein (TIGR03435 family)